MIRRLAALALVPLVFATPVLAEKAATGATVPRPSGPPPAAAPVKSKAVTEAEMVKAQKAAAARDKAWDQRTRKSMTSICKGC